MCNGVFCDRVSLSPHELIFTMLDQNDIKILRGMFRENNEIFGRELKRDIRDEMHSVVNAAVSASEVRMTRRLEEVRNDIIEVIDNGILPQIDRHDREIIRLKKVTGIA